MSDSLRALRELAKLVGNRRAGRPTHVSTLIRWHRVGIRGERLPLVRVGGIWMGTEAALHSFIAAIQRAPSPDSPSRSSTATEERLELIDQQLDQAKW